MYQPENRPNQLNTLKIVLIGTIRFVGAHLLREVLTLGHEVTIIARNPARLIMAHNYLTVVPGEVTHMGPWPSDWPATTWC